MPRIAFVPFVSFLCVIFVVPPLPSFLSNGERKKNDHSPGGASSSFLWTWEGSDQSRPAESRGMILGAGKRGAAGGGRSWPDGVATIKHSNQRAL